MIRTGENPTGSHERRPADSPEVARHDGKGTCSRLNGVHFARANRSGSACRAAQYRHFIELMPMLG